LGTLVNSGFLSNRALITLEGVVDLSGGGIIEQVCYDYPTRGTELSGSGQVVGGTIIKLSCNPPIADDDTYSTSENISLPIDSTNGVLNGDIPGNNDDIPGDNSSTLLVSDVTDDVDNGSLTLNEDGSFNYIPNTSFNGEDSFTYTVLDGNGGTDIGDVTITVTSVNQDPTANPDSATVAEDSGPTTIDVLLNDSI